MPIMRQAGLCLATACRALPEQIPARVITRPIPGPTTANRCQRRQLAITGTGYSLEGKITHPAGKSDTIEADAPAIKAADIGVAMGTGTEVAKNAGRMILSDDNFATIVFAVEQGRKLYDNLSKYIRFVLLELVAFVLTFLGATLFNIAAGQPFTPAQILWINFLVNAPFGVALGFDKQTPGLMNRRPRPRGESILTKGVMVTCGLVGMFIAVANLALIATGKNHYGSVKTGQSMGLVAFSLMLVVAAFEARSEKDTAFDTDIFNSSKMNVIAAAEIAGAFLITQANFLNKLLGTAQLTAAQWGFAFLAAVVLLLGWEAGKLIARRTTRAEQPAVPVR
jgi:Ca2+-transporting ATPase